MRGSTRLTDPEPGAVLARDPATEREGKRGARRPW